MDRWRMRELVAGARVGTLGTVDERGRPHLVPFCFALEGDTVYSAVDDKPKRTRDLKRLRNVRRRPQATVLVDHYEEDWDRVWWVRLRGRARVLEGGEERERAVALLRDKYPQYRERPPGGPVIAVDVEEWLGWAATP